uniref:probable RNA-dependent RNA polymerase 1 n=1 Tax=Erigeron canadensis TaxID=72917 RepID=UPI001CB94700|nr:probable RNA-dependent RNA polymerase 1 [Erigeron canadensis]
MGKTINVYGFPSLDSAEKIKTALESYTGKGTIYALEVRKSKGGPRVYAKVQFTTRERAAYILDLAYKKRLWYDSSYLSAWEIDHDIEPRAKQFAFGMEDVTLLFGCQISKEIFSVLCGMRHVSVNFGFGLRKLYIVIPYPTTSYKLELRYESIRQAQLHRSHGLAASYLVIQLYRAPRIYQKAEDNCLKFCMDPPNDQWFRTTDFTPSSSIGQSSHLCLELPHYADLSNLASHFQSYAESKRPFRLVPGHSFTQNLELVPIVGPTRGSYLPYNVVYKICALVQHGCIPGPVLDDNFFKLLKPQRRDASIEYALDELFRLEDCCYDPARWITEEYRKKNRLRSPAISLDAGLVYVRRAQITPSKVYFCQPEVNVSNRVLRRFAEYIDDFLRVSFLDEELEKLYAMNLSPCVTSKNKESRTSIYRRILSVLKNGIVIGDKKFEFLAFSSSQLRDNSAWMFASTGRLNAAAIRDWMGDFSSIKNVAKYAARLGQSFSSSKESLSVERHEIESILDIEVVASGTKLVFSDGIGKISAEFAKSVSNKCGYDFVPSAFQIRYGGYKGVVAVDPTSSVKLSLRKSMCKFESYTTKLDILAISKYQPCYMNRQVITLLSTLGVPDHVFQGKQKQAVDLLDVILKGPLKAQEALDLMSPGENTSILKEMLLCGYKPNAEPFLSMLLQAFRATKLFELRTKARIFVHKGRSMMGCLDETGTLDYGEVFVQYSGAGIRVTGGDHSGTGLNNCEIVDGKVVVAKNPCLYPGDVRVLMAVNVPALHHMVDCVVFPQKGPRPHPNECSGSDLDGDDYFVCWDPDLIPPVQIEPMEYTPAPSVQLDHNVTIEEVVEYFAHYIVNDNLGIIANAHTVFADREPKKAMADPCVDLAKLHSIAVDFPKSGVPAEIPTHLRVNEYPDFMEKPSDKTTYKSQSVIGKLFREVKDIAPTNCPFNTFTLDVARRTYDTDMEVVGFEKYVKEAVILKTEYDYRLGNLMDSYGIKTEAELVSGSIMKMSKSIDKRNAAEVVGLLVKLLRMEAKNWFKEGRGDRDVVDDDLCAKASAWYHVTYHPSYWGRYNQGMKRDHFLSFPWCVYDKLAEIKKRRKAALRKDAHSVWLPKKFSAAANLV